MSQGSVPKAAEAAGTPVGATLVVARTALVVTTLVVARTALVVARTALVVARFATDRR